MKSFPKRKPFSIAKYENYVPIQNDLGDLLEVFSWLKQEDQAAYCIAMNGQKLGEDMFSSGAIEHYVYQLLSEYSKKWLLKRDHADFLSYIVLLIKS